jgi:O-antigen/teichoic acid export membrane protein
MAGRFLAMPLTFLVPIVLVRVFSVEEFGIYKQLFMIFYILLPIIDLGISQSLFYFIPKYQEQRDRILSQTFLLQVPIVVILTIIFFIFRQEIGSLFSGDGEALADYIPLLGIFVLLWHLSNIFENLLIVEKKAFQAGAVTFLSELLRSLVTIAIGLYGGNLEHLMLGLVGTSVIRCLFMGWYIKKTVYFSLNIQKKMIRTQLIYSIPFGLAIIVNTMVLYSHQYIVSISSSPRDFAIYVVGCFSLPIFSIVVDSVVKASLVKMSELTRNNDKFITIAGIISNSIRKLWILFFPLFVFLFVIAEELIVVLFTKDYSESVSIFRIFVFTIPLYALLVQHVPRIFEATRFILITNIFALALSSIVCFLLFELFGLEGAAIGFIVVNLIWKMMFLVKCKKMFNVPIRHLLPLNSMIKVSFYTSLIGVFVFYVNEKLLVSDGMSIVISAMIFWLFCVFVYYFLNIINIEEKNILKNIIIKYKN